MKPTAWAVPRDPRARLRQALATIAIQLAAFTLGGIALLFGQVAGQSVGTTCRVGSANAAPNGAFVLLIAPGH